MPQAEEHQLETDEPDLINGRYSLMNQIGRGTTGLVYTGWDHHLDRQVAIKIIHQELLDNREVIGRFETEVRLTAQLEHPGIVSVFERCELTGGAVGYIMSLAVGRSLEEFLDELRRIDDPWRAVSLADRLTMFMKVLDVIAYAHSQGVVHRDLKPANIMLGEHGEVRILDWGLARLLHPGRDIGGQHENAFDAFFGDSDEHVPTDQPDEIAATRVSGDAPATAIEPAAPAEAATRLHGQPEVGEDTAEHQPTSDVHTAGQRRRRSTSVHHSTGRSARHETTTSGRQSTSTSQRAASQRLRKRTSTQLPVVSDRRNERSTQLGAVLGSPAYMSPEQASGAANTADERADIYSLGVILVELLSLHTPCERRDGEPLLQFIERVRSGERHRLTELWPEAPGRLEEITELALALQPTRRFPDCEAFRHQLSELLDEVSASYSEMERLRLEREREGAWFPHGTWNYGARPGLDPFTEPVVAYEGEAIGQVMHPELGGLLLGGTGLQVYPVSLPVSDDLRLSLEVSINRGREFSLFVRGVPPSSSYCFRIGAYAGRWITIARTAGEHDLFHPDLLSMRALEGSASTFFDASRGHRRRVVVEVVGARLSIQLDGGEPFEVQDPCPLMGPLHRQVAIGTTDSQVVLHNLVIERRRAPLMIPTYSVANELLRQKLYPQAIDYYRRFLDEHEGGTFEVEARFMLCLAFLEAGHRVQAERELRGFLDDHLDHRLAQDAIFELARLAVEPTGIERAVRTVLSYQESDDMVRSRFCLWVMHILSERVNRAGLSDEVIADLRLLRHLISGFSDQQLILETIALGINESLQDYANRLVDAEREHELAELSRAMDQCRNLGYDFQVVGLHTSEEYEEVARRLRSIPDDDPLRKDTAESELYGFDTVRDWLRLAGMGCEAPLLDVLMATEPSPVRRILRAALLLRAGRVDEAKEDLHVCFRLMDIIEVERTSQEVTATARLAFFGLGYLPWEVIWEPISAIRRGQEIQALAGWLAEGLADRDAAAQAYRFLKGQGGGYGVLAREGLERLGIDPEAL